MTIVLSVLLVVCLVVIGYLCVAWAQDASTSDVIAAELNRIYDDVRDRLAKSKAECRRLSDVLDERDDTVARLGSALEHRTRERDQWRYQLDQLLDPIVRLKMLEPGPPIYVVANQERLDELKREIESTPLPRGE